MHALYSSSMSLVLRSVSVHMHILSKVAGIVSVIWIACFLLIAFAPWLHIPVYLGPLVMYVVLVVALCLPLPILQYRSRLWLLKKLVSGRLTCTCVIVLGICCFNIVRKPQILVIALSYVAACGCTCHASCEHTTTDTFLPVSLAALVLQVHPSGCSMW